MVKPASNAWERSPAPPALPLLPALLVLLGCPASPADLGDASIVDVGVVADVASAADAATVADAGVVVDAAIVADAATLADAEIVADAATATDAAMAADARGGGDAGPRFAGAAFVWQGFRHEWLRTVLGFRTPHRISKLISAVVNEQHRAEDPWLSSADFFMGQNTGVDGDYMKPLGRYAAWRAAGLYASQGAVHLQWTDDGDGSTYPQARTDLDQIVELDLSSAALGHGALQRYAMLLRGFALDTSCDDAMQPPDEPCNSDGIWPFKFQISIEECGREGAQLQCPLRVRIHRAWTPNRGGLPPLDEKPFNDRIDYDLRVYYIVVGGDAAAFAVTRGAAIQPSGRAREDQAQTGTAIINGEPGHALGLAALTGIGFEFTRTGSEDKTQHLGRYIGTLDFAVTTQSYVPSTGELTLAYLAQVWVPSTVYDTDVNYRLEPALLQLGDAAAQSVAAEVQGSLCANSNEAPFFSEWQRCGEVDTGPEQDEQLLPLQVP